MDITFYLFFVWVAALLLAIWALCVAERFAVRTARNAANPLPIEDFPRVAVILPIKGVDDDTASNLEALLNQDYPDFRLIFTVESDQDPVVPILENIARENSRVEIVVAGLATHRGQKVHNQLAAVDRTTERDEVLAFMDADATPGPHWLHALTLPTTWGDDFGAATGYRYYIPVTGHTANKVVSVINAGVAALFGPYRRTFAWGGSMAIRRQDFFAYGLHDLWQDALSDDYVLAHCVKKLNKKKIQFVPQCVVASDANFNWASLFEFAVRQYRITKVCEPFVWLTAIGGALIFLTAYFYTLSRAVLGICGLLGIVRPDLINDPYRQIAMFAILFLLSNIRGYFLILGGTRLHPEYTKEIHSTFFWATLGYPWTVLINLLALLGASFGREIIWRGVEYIMLSRTQTLVRRPHTPATHPTPKPYQPAHRD